MENHNIMKFVREELIRAEKKWPNYYTDIIHATSLISEEAGETIQAALDYVYDNGSKQEIINEAIQTIAMCVRLLKNIDNLKSYQHFINEQMSFNND